MRKDKVNLVLSLTAIMLTISILLGNQYSYAETVEVEIRTVPEDPDKRYVLHPEEIIVEVGTTVVWTNMHDRTTSITSGKAYEIGAGAFFNSGPIKPGEKFSHTFNNEGHFPYFAGSATGNVIVKGESEGSTIVLSSNIALPSERIIIQGTGFAPHVFSFPSKLTVKFNDKILKTIPEKVVIDESGFFIAGVWLPFDVSKGDYQITVTDSAGNMASAELTIRDFTDPEWETAYAVGKFLSSRPPKPDQIFKIQYRAVNGTVEGFNVAHEAKESFGNLIFQVHSSNEGILEVKVPRNYPHAIEATGLGEPIAYESFSSVELEYKIGLTDCFFIFLVPFNGNSKIELLWAYPPFPPRNNVPGSCIPQTVVEDVHVRDDGTISPLHQFRAGVAAEDIACKEGLDLVIRPDGKPYCVTPSTAERLATLWK